MIIQHNIMALNSYNKLSTNNSAVQKNLEKLSSGYRINRAGDDAAGLAISEKMRAQITGLERAKLNAQDGISLVQTAEGALTEVHSMLNRLVELGTESANGIYQAEDRQKIQAEVNQITEEIDRISDATNFNGINLLDGSLGKKINDSLGLSDTNGIDYTNGVDITNKASEGAAAEFELTLDQAMGDGDKITITYRIPNSSGSGPQKSVTLSYTSAAPAANSLNFTGSTKEEQLESIRDTLMKSTHADLADFGNNLENAQTVPSAGKYSVSINNETNTLSIKANDMGKAGKLEILSVELDDASAAAGMTNSSTGGSITASTGVGYKASVNPFLTSNPNLTVGDTVRFNFTLADGSTTANVDLKITDQIYSTDHDKMAANIAKALEKAHFADNTTTAADESQYKVSDFMNVHANATAAADNAAGAANSATGAISFTLKADGLASAVNANSFKLNSVARATEGSTTFTAYDASSVTSSALTNMTTGVKNATTVTFGTDFTIGDQVVLKGKLKDGRNFEVTLTAAKDNSAANSFTAGGAGHTSASSAANIKAALSATSTIVTIKDDDGNVTATMSADKVFASSAASTTSASDIFISAAGGTLTMANNTIGVVGTKGVTGEVELSIKATNSKATGTMVQVGQDVKKASTMVDFSDVSKLEYGMAISFGVEGNMKTFELMKDAADKATDDDNVKVVVANLENASAEDVAKAFQDALNKELKTSSGNYTDWAEAIGVGTAGDAAPANGPAIITQGADGVTNSAVTLQKAAYSDTVGDFDTKATYGENSVTINYSKDSDGNLKLKAGDTIEINGKTYQFDSDIRNVKSGNNLIKVTDFNDPDNVANAIKTALNADDPSLAVKINDDKSVTIYDANAKTKPTVELGNDKGGLTIQVGDTNDDFNKVTVFVEDMSSKGLGIDGLNVSDQGLSGGSIDKVKSAIETVSVARGNLGALQNRLEHTINNLSTTTENMTAAESRIRDTDMAKEMMNFTKNNVLVQAAQAMLSQANQQPQQVLQLLR